MTKRGVFRVQSIALPALLVLVLAIPVSAVADNGVSSHAQAEQRQNAVAKTGFFNGFARGQVNLIEENSYRKLSYLVAKDLVVTYQDQPYEHDLLIHSIVRLVIVDGVVVEIVLLQESS